MPDQRIRILVVDDHPMVLKGLTSTLNVEPDMEVVGCASTGSAALKLFRETLPDVTIMDIKLKPDMTGIQTTIAIRKEFPNTRIVVLSAHQEEEVIYNALKAGAVTYLFKEMLGDDLVRTIREVHAGGRPIPSEVARKFADRVNRSSLTARELEVFRLMAKGLRNKEIAHRLGIREQTVQDHVKHILTKLGVTDRTSAVVLGASRGMLDLAT